MFIGLLIVGYLITPSNALSSTSNLINNGSFETGDLTGWSHSGNVGIASAKGYRDCCGGINTFPDGEYAVAFGGGDRPATGVLTQEFLTNFGQTYDLSFVYGRFQVGSGGPQSLKIEVINLADNQTFFNKVITDSSGEVNLATLFDDYNYQFVAIGSATLLSFSDISLGTIHSDGVIDNIQVNAVPIPASLWMLTSGITCIAGIRLRRKKR